MTDLPEPPEVGIEIVEDRTDGARCDEGFLRMRRLTLRNRWDDGTASAAYHYDVVERDALDAVAIVLEAEGEGEPRVCLRSAIRPPLSMRRGAGRSRRRDPYCGYDVPFEDDGGAVLWEVPAGLLEPGERDEAGLRACAVRETLEEVGLEVAPGAFSRLGPGACLSPGILGEKAYFLTARVDPARRGVPTEDGSPVEERAEVRFVPLRVALAAVDDGRIADLKTEVAIRRLAAARGVR